MTKIAYVGVKRDGETAFFHETGGITWLPGAVREVRPELAKKMLVHPDVFAPAPDDAELSDGAALPPLPEDAAAPAAAPPRLSLADRLAAQNLDEAADDVKTEIPEQPADNTAQAPAAPAAPAAAKGKRGR